MKNNRDIKRSSAIKPSIRQIKTSNTDRKGQRLPKPFSHPQLKVISADETEPLVVDQESPAAKIQQTQQREQKKSRVEISNIVVSVGDSTTTNATLNRFSLSHSIIDQINNARQAEQNTHFVGKFKSVASVEQTPKQKYFSQSHQFKRLELFTSVPRQPKEPSSLNNLKPPNSDRNIKEPIIVFKPPFPEFQYYMSWTHFANQPKISYLPFKFTQSMQKQYPSQQLLQFVKLFSETFSMNYNVLQYCKKFKQSPYTLSKPKQVTLPPFDEKKYRGTIVFDMDETLMHCNEKPEMPADHVLKVKLSPTQEVEIFVSERPNVIKCLEQLSKHFEIILFTASHQAYADVVLKAIDPESKYLNQRFYRDSCYSADDGLLIKDLRIFNRDLKKLVLVDNAPYSYCCQLANGVPILPYTNNKSDKELLWLTNYLMNLQGDFTKYNRQFFKMHFYQEGMTLEETLVMIFQKSGEK